MSNPFFARPPPSSMAQHHICGFYFVDPNAHIRKYLTQVKLDVHASIIDSISRTTLTQTFINPYASSLEEIRYTFPLYDGVSVVGFVCTVGDRIIKGVVKEKARARADYQAAISRGETAGLLEQLPDASDVFTTSVGNIPAKSEIKVDITYLGELKHDAQVDGIRFTIPTSIAPRYGSYPGEVLRTNAIDSEEGITITVDAEVPNGSHITKIQSPSHTISVSLGTTSIAPTADPSFQKASATLALGKAELEKDFVLQVVATNIGNPIAILEEHPTAKTRALMATLVPKFSLPPARPEIVFVCDRSGSMGDGRKIPNLQAALRLFVKSLNIGTKFNICSFGSRFQFLWDRSQSYDQSSVEAAMRHIDTFNSNFGGTKMYEPMEETFKRRYTDMDLEVFLLTDGEIWAQEDLFNLINKNVAQSKGAIRVFTLGIGTAASHALIEGVARAGNGFSQAVTDDEEMSSKVVRMLKGALFPHVKDYSLEVKYEKAQEDDYEIIEKVLDGLVVSVPESEKPAASETLKQPISLFDSSLKEDVEMQDAGKYEGDRYSHLPLVDPPKILQAPFDLPPLFPFNRTSVYLLMSEDTPRQIPKSVIVRGTSAQGPLQLEIPVTILERKEETIHQLAAKKAVHELEEGRGWIYHAKTNGDQLLKDKYDGHFQDMVEREGVRLGVKYQVGGKWCSFVAVDANGEETGSSENIQREPSPSHFDNEFSQFAPSQYVAPSQHSFKGFPITDGAALGGGLFGSAAPAPAPMQSTLPASLPGAALYAPQSAQFRAPLPSRRRAHRDSAQVTSSSLFGSSSALPPPPPANARPVLASKAARRSVAPQPHKKSAGDLFGGALLHRSEACEIDNDDDELAAPSPPAPSDAEKLQSLIVLQDFQGFWAWSTPLFQHMEWDENTVITAWHADRGVGQKIIKANPIGNRNLLATACVVAWLRRERGAEKDTWELVVDKAVAWLEGQIGALGLEVDVEDVIQAAGRVV